MIIKNAFHSAAWGEPIAIYFFLIGASATATVISAFGWVFGIQRFKPTGLLANLSAILLLALVPPLLVADLGRPDRFFHLLTGFHITSPMAWGVAILITYFTLLCVYTYFIYAQNKRFARLFGLVAMVLAVSMHWYTGVVMQLNPGRDLNHTALAPILFLTGAFISGTAITIIVFWVKNLLRAGTRIPDELILELGRYMLYGVVFEMLLLFSELAHSIYGTQAEYVIHEMILMGPLKVYYFWFNLVALSGAFVLLTLSSAFSLPRKNLGATVLASGLVILAIWGMRHWWVYGGQYLQTFY